MKYEYIFWDFNGTIIDDLDLCLDLLNVMVKKQGLKLVSKEKYKEIFGFPIIDYYKRAGLSFEQESFASMAVWFIDNYQPASFNCKLYDGVIDMFNYFKELGLKQVLLSASEINNLKEQTDHFNITKYFDAILGLDNIHARGKIGIGEEFVKANKIDPSKVLMIGDTVHDKEVADALGFDSLLVANGHQSKEVLKKVTDNVLDDILEVKAYIK